MSRFTGKKLFVIAFFAVLFCCCGSERVIHTAAGGRVKTLDPAQADDLASRNLAGAIFDTLVEYDYIRRPYTLKPAMLSEMPVCSADFKRYDFKLRDDLYFAEHPEIKVSKHERRITSKDVLYSILRIADSRNHSPVYWIFRGKIAGLDDFHLASKKALPGDMSLYRSGIPGFVIRNEREFSILLTRPDPRFLYILAMPNAGIVPGYAVEKFGDDFARKPLGSGPFILRQWINDYRITLVRNPDYRREYFAGAENPADRNRPLPLADRVEVRLIKQPMTSWLLFLQGNLDYNALSKDNIDLLAGGGGKLPQSLQKRNIRLIQVPEFEIRYVGFNFYDPLLGGNIHLRRAMSLAYNVGRRVEHFGGQMIPAKSVIPPGVGGHDPAMDNPFVCDDVDQAQEELKKAGFPGGIDPANGRNLEFSFDQSGNTSAYRQLGELTVADFAAIGIKVHPVLNNNPRFYEKLRQKKVQLFRLSWIGDYPDAENFLQLFYSGNIGSCNRTGFSDPEYDRMYEKILTMPDSPERTALYRKMAALLAEKCVWILEGYPISWLLCHSWLENYVPGDFAFNSYKYLSVDPAKREKLKSAFRPLSFRELQQ